MEFYNKIAEAGLGTLTSRDLVKMQMDLGGVAGEEMMSPEVVEDSLVALQDFHFATLELIHKAPKQHPELLDIINKAIAMDKKIVLHINCEVLLPSEAEKLLEVLKNQKVVVVIDFPFCGETTENLKANELYQKTILALKKLNAAGYGIKEGLDLNLLYKPNAAVLPEAQAELEKNCRELLDKNWHIQFNTLIVAANSPVGCFAKAYLKDPEIASAYCELLEAAFDAKKVKDLSCLSQIFVAADGSIYDCKFSAAIQLGVRADIPNIRFFKYPLLAARPIQVSGHCFACTAGRTE